MIDFVRLRMLQAECDKKDRRIAELETENTNLKTQMECVHEQIVEFTKFLSEMTGGRMNKVGYLAKSMIKVANDYQQERCEKCDMVFHVDKDEVERWKAEALGAYARLKAENDDYFYKLAAVMHSVDKWLDGEELEQDEVNRAITMREKTLRIVEKLQKNDSMLMDVIAERDRRIEELKDMLDEVFSDTN